ncbi:MAG: PEP-CTERM sorting domain-containing protein [Rhodocyclaceae bacterium]
MIKKITVVLALSAAAIAQAAPVTFNFVYQDAAGVGFNDATLGAQRKAALVAAGETWGSLLNASYAGETINISVSFNSASTSISPLASTSAGNTVYANAALGGQGVANRIYTAPLAEHLAGHNLNGSTVDFGLSFNPNVSTYLGLDGSPGTGQYDFETYALRGIGNALGFHSRIYRSATPAAEGAVKGGFYAYYDSASNSLVRLPGIYDSFLADGNGTSLLAMTDAQRFTALTSGSLYWTGANAVAANGGAYVRLNSMAPTADGSITGNVAHYFDVSVDSLMSYPPVAGVSKTVDPIMLGVMKDIGWNVSAVPEPSTYAMLFAGLAIIGSTARRRMRT